MDINNIFSRHHASISVSFKLIHKYSTKNHYELKSDSNGTKYETDNTLT